MANKQLLQSAGDGTAVPAGYIGELRTATNDANSIASGTIRNTGTLTLTPGVYLMWATLGTDFSSTNPNVTKLEISLSTTSAAHNMTYKSSFPVPSTIANGFGKLSTAPAVITVTTSTTWYGVGTITASGNVDYQYTSLNAVRIA